MHTHHAVPSPSRTVLRSTGWLLLAIAIWLLAGLSAAHAQAKPGATPAMPPMFLEDTSPQPLVPTVRAFEEATRQAGWSMLGVTNMAGILSERGFTVAPVLIFEPCSGRYSAALLGRDETRFVASMIPCRVAIYQTSAGQVVISRINSVAMADMIGGPAAPVMRSAGEGVESIVRATLRKLAN